MMRLAADEDVDNDVIRGLRLRSADIDIVRVQDAGLRGADDPTVLDWAARDGRVLITRDARTMAAYAYARVEEGRPMPGVLVLRSDLSIGRAIEELLIVATCSREGDWEGQVGYVPF